MSDHRAITASESRSATRSATRVVAWGLLVFAATRIIDIVLASASMASGVGQAIAAEWGAGRLGVTWSDPHEPMPDGRAMARRALTGAAIGAVAAALVVAFAWATQAALVERIPGATPWSLVVVGLVTAGLTSVRDELVLHGIALRALSSVSSPIARALACGATSAAAAFGDASSPAVLAVVAQGLLGVGFGALWVRDRGAWLPWGAHTAWIFVSGTLLDGGVFQIRVASSSWGGGDGGLLGGGAAVLVLAAVALAAISAARGASRRNSAASADVG